jgi:membrane-associated protease RseP (regulator of RpoE activity)
MIRAALGRVLFVAIGAAAAVVVFLAWRPPTDPVPQESGAARAPFAPASTFSSIPSSATAADYAGVERRLQRLEAALAEAAVDRQHLTEQLDAITAQLAARSRVADDTGTTPATFGSAVTAPEAAAHPAANAAAVDDGKSSMEHALAAAGLDAATAADIKQRHDGLAMAEIYLRDQATRDQWLDSPRFASEMAAIEAQRTPLRNEIGDDAYDRYLFALGQANRVRVDEVLTQSPAEQAGVQPGDLIVRYGEARLFAPGELVDETRSGRAGETVQLEIVRNGERLQVFVPRGPLGLRVAATHGAPEAG